MKRKRADLIYGNMSDVGRVRTENQDYYGRYSGSFGQLIIVCDGMGGYEGGAIASRLAVESIADHFVKLSHHYDAHYELKQSFMVAQHRIKEYSHQNPETQSMGTTAVLMLIVEDSYWFANVGDSRLYLKRAGETTQLTKDHSYVQGMIDNGILTEEQAAEHPKRNIITKALGTDKYMPDISGPHPLYKADVFMLCTDGLYQYFTIDEISSILNEDPQKACETFMNIANQHGSDDNMTVQIVKSNVGKKSATASLSTTKLLKWIVVVFFAFSILFLSSLYFIFSITNSSSPPKKETGKDKPQQESSSSNTSEIGVIIDTGYSGEEDR